MDWYDSLCIPRGIDCDSVPLRAPYLEHPLRNQEAYPCVLVLRPVETHKARTVAGFAGIGEFSSDFEFKVTIWWSIGTTRALLIFY